MRHYIGQLSLIHGWLPMLAQVGTAAVLSYAVYRRSRLMPVIAGLAMGVVLAAVAYWYLDALGVAGEPAPPWLWLWIAGIGLSAGLTGPIGAGCGGGAGR